MKKLLVMGGSYFIGKHVVELLKNTYAIFVLNRGTHPFNDSNITEIICDRNDPELMKSVLKPFKFDYVVDISGFTKAQSEILVNALRVDSIKKFVYISTSAVYNINAKSAPYNETDPLGGDSPFKNYAKRKIEAESYLSRVFNENILTIFRPPLVYGEDNYVLRERLIFYLLENNLPIYYPDSNNLIQFVYVKDLAHNVFSALKGTVPGGIFNVGDNQGIRFKEWVKACANVVGVEANIVPVNLTSVSLDSVDFFPFFDYDNVLEVHKIKTYDPTETTLDMGLSAAYNDYKLLEVSLKIPDKMKSSWNLLNKHFNQ